jgi:pyruvate formate lyase activating enzyme
MGREVTTEDVFAEIAKDDAFYLNSDGGYTLSGGEPLFYADFCIELTGLCADAGYGGVIETSGYGDTDKFVELCRRLDLVFFDIKHTDDAEHKKLTGVSNKLILDNLRAIQSVAKEIIIRTPLIPGMNDDESNIRETAKLCARLDKVSSWEILPYHRLGEHKYESLGKEYSLMGVVPPDKKQVEKYREIGDSILGSKGKICVVNTSAAG